MRRRVPVRRFQFIAHIEESEEEDEDEQVELRDAQFLSGTIERYSADTWDKKRVFALAHLS